MEFETSNRDVLSVKVDRKRKSPVSMLLRAMGFTTDKEILELFEDVDNHPEHQFMKTTIEKDTQVGDHDEALLEFYRRLRPGEPPSVENAKNLLENLFFNPRRYDLGRVGRYKLNRRLVLDIDKDQTTLSPNDIIELLRSMIRINKGEQEPDDIDHLGNRRVRAVGELIQNQVRVGMMRMERVIKERMTTQMDPATTTPAALINIRPVVGLGPGVLWWVAAVPVYGPDQPAGRADPTREGSRRWGRVVCRGRGRASTFVTSTTPTTAGFVLSRLLRVRTSACWARWLHMPGPTTTASWRRLIDVSIMRCRAQTLTSWATP